MKKIILFFIFVSLTARAQVSAQTQMPAPNSEATTATPSTPQSAAVTTPTPTTATPAVTTPTASETATLAPAAPSTPQTPPAPTKPAPSALSFFGDFRYRQQYETQEPKQERSMQRLQVRLGVLAQVQEDLKVTVRLMTGSSANSGNQTLGDEKAPGMPRRNFGLDQAYFDYQALSILNVYGGKMPQPFTFAGKNQMLLDRDITLEGLAAKMVIPVQDKLEIFIQGGSFWVRENYDSTFGEEQTANMLNAGQIGVQWKPEDWNVNAGLGSFSYVGLQDTPPANLTANGGANGNTLDVNGNYPTNFDIQEMFLEIKKKLGPVDASLFWESLVNKDANDLKNAHTYGITATYKKLSLTWAYEEVQKDAVVGLFTDSDFAGGVTSSRGTVWSAAYKLSNRVQLIYTTFKNQNSIDTTAMNYSRSHLDLFISF